jgi:hypothetical protein
MQLTEHQAVRAAEIGDQIASERWTTFCALVPTDLPTTQARLALNLFAVRGAAAALAGETEDACPLQRDAASEYGHGLRAAWFAAYAAARKAARRRAPKRPLS